MTEVMGYDPDIKATEEMPIVEPESSVRGLVARAVGLLPEKHITSLFHKRLGYVEHVKHPSGRLVKPGSVRYNKKYAHECFYSFVEHGLGLLEAPDHNMNVFERTNHIPLYVQVFGDDPQHEAPNRNIEEITKFRHNGIVDYTTIAETKSVIARMLKSLSQRPSNYDVDYISEIAIDDETLYAAILTPYSFETQQMYHDRIEALGIEALKNSPIYTTNLASRPANAPQRI